MITTKKEDKRFDGEKDDAKRGADAQSTPNASVQAPHSDFNEHFGTGGVVETATVIPSVSGCNANANMANGFQRHVCDGTRPETGAAAARATLSDDNFGASGSAGMATADATTKKEDDELMASSVAESGVPPLKIPGAARTTFHPASDLDADWSKAITSGSNLSPDSVSGVVAPFFTLRRFVEKHWGSLAFGAALALGASAGAWLLSHWSPHGESHLLGQMDVPAESRLPAEVVPLAAGSNWDQRSAASPAASRFSDEREAVSGFRTADMRTPEHIDRTIPGDSRDSGEDGFIDAQGPEIRHSPQRVQRHMGRLTERLNELSRRIADVETRLGVDAASKLEPEFTPLSIRAIDGDYFVTVLGDGGKRHVLRRGERLAGWRLIEADFDGRAAIFENADGRKHRSLL